MAPMRREQQIDGAPFDLFLRSGVCMDGARRFLHPELLDVGEPEIDPG